MPDDPDREILLEIQRMGAALEVRAVSAGDGLEVAFIAPATASNHDIEALARMKLGYVRRHAAEQERKPSGKKPPGGGVVV